MTQDKTEEQTERFQMRAAPSFLRAVDEWRRKEADLPSRSEAIRRLVEQALSGKKKR
jgi:metal-responsive CopG/Arc/MetJ family transcriptional regulator